MTLEQLAAGWREQASSPFVPEDVRRAVGACAEELEAAIRAEQTAILSQTEAAEELGVSTSTLRRWETAGLLERVGSKAQYRRCDLVAAQRGETPEHRPALELHRGGR